MGGRKRFEHATHFHVAVVQKRQRNVQKSVMHVAMCEVVVLLIKPIILLFVDLVVAIASLDLRPTIKRQFFHETNQTLIWVDLN